MDSAWRLPDWTQRQLVAASEASEHRLSLQKVLQGVLPSILLPGWLLTSFPSSWMAPAHFSTTGESGTLHFPPRSRAAGS